MIDRRVYNVENELSQIKKLVYEHLDQEAENKIEIMRKMDEIMDYHKRQQGFIAGIIFAGSTIASGVVFFFDRIFK